MRIASSPPPLLSNSNAYAFVVFVSCFVLAFVVGSLTLIPYDSNAESTESEVNLSIEPVVALSVSPQPTLLLDLTPTPAGFEVAEEITVDASTNNLTGYTLTMNAISNTTTLTHTNGTNTISSTTSITATALPTNTWGYNKGSGATSFLRIPPLSTPDTLTTSSAPITNDITIVTVGAKADINILPGVYSNILIFSAVPNYVPAPTVTSVSPAYAGAGGTITITGTNFYGAGTSNAVTRVTIGDTPCMSFNVTSNTSLTCILPSLTDGTYPIAVITNVGISNKDVAIVIVLPMQFFDTAACDAMPIYYPASSPPAGSEIDLVDIRDGKIYKIRKLPADATGTTGWCWMVDNLSLQPSGASMTLDSTDSDMVSGTYTLTATNVYNPNTIAYCANLSTATYLHRCGMLYNWTTATTGSNITSGSAPNSICPKNWRLPVQGNHTTLSTALGWTDAASVVSSPWRGLYAGFYGSGSFQLQSTDGWHSTATANSALSTDNWHMRFSTSWSPQVQPDRVTTGAGYKSTGLSLRCITR